MTTAIESQEIIPNAFDGYFMLMSPNSCVYEIVHMNTVLVTHQGAGVCVFPMGRSPRVENSDAKLKAQADRFWRL